MRGSTRSRSNWNRRCRPFPNSSRDYRGLLAIMRSMDAKLDLILKHLGLEWNP
jgi:hypothetical protein